MFKSIYLFLEDFWLLLLMLLKKEKKAAIPLYIYNCALKIKSIKFVSSQKVLCKMSGIISGIHSNKHIRYMSYKNKKVHVINSFIGNKVYKLYFCLPNG